MAAMVVEFILWLGLLAGLVKQLLYANHVHKA